MQPSPEAILTANPRYWTWKAIATDASLIVLAIVSAYLQYVAYPALMASTPYNETSISLNVSFLTYQYYAVRCGPQFCQNLSGVPALDFFQLFVLILVAVNILRFRSYSNAKAEHR
jgi:hypothetical protein